MTPPRLNVEVILLYGSLARGDSDSLSDYDILLVDSNIASLCRASQLLRSRGYSCSEYTWQKLEHMAQHNALFLQHLKQEGLVLKDAKNQLATLLEKYEPRADYSEDIERTKEVVALTDYTCTSRPSVGWALDVLAVAVRNLGILHLANHGEYIFSYQQVLNNLLTKGILKSEDFLLLASLRRYKGLYRRQCYGSLPGIQTLVRIKKSVSRCFRIDFDSRTLPTPSFIQVQTRRSLENWDRYCRFRLLEAAFVTHIHHNGLGWRGSAQDALKMIKNQNHYGLFYQDLSVPLRELARKVMIECHG